MMTQVEYYKSEQWKYPEALLLLREYDYYEILGEKANAVLPLLKPVLTHKDSGEMFCYGNSYFSFGKHNLEKVLPVLIKANFRIAIIDYNEYRKTPEYKAEEKRFWDKYRADKKKEEEKQRIRNQQELELQFDW